MPISGRIAPGARHPAKYNDRLLPYFELFLRAYPTILDPFAGTGKIFNIRVSGRIYGVELEPEWAIQAPVKPNCQMIIGSAINLPFSDNSIASVGTSPTYGNRMADKHNARDNSVRNTYTHAIGRQLHPENTGQLQWGDKYRELHEKAWAEVYRVLEPSGIMVLNIADHIRKGVRIPVSKWHVTTLAKIGILPVYSIEIPTPGNRFGENSNLRVGHESIYVLRKGK